MLSLKNVFGRLIIITQGTNKIILTIDLGINFLLIGPYKILFYFPSGLRIFWWTKNKKENIPNVIYPQANNP